MESECRGIVVAEGYYEKERLRMEERGDVWGRSEEMLMIMVYQKWRVEY